MGNEIFFLLDVLAVGAFAIGALRFGKSALISLIALNAILANLFIAKQMDLFGLTVTCSDVFAVGGIFGLNLLQEFYGKEAAQKAIAISFFSLIFFVLVSQVHLWYLPAEVDQTQSAFKTIFSWTPRIVIASIVVYFIVQKIDVFLFGVLKERFQGRWLSLRVGISLVVTQGIDTVLFSFLGLYGFVSSLLDVMVVSFAIKCVVILASAPFAKLARKTV